MQQRFLIIGALAAAAILAIALISQQRAPATRMGMDEQLFPTLAKADATVDRITVRRGSEVFADFVRDGEQYKVENRGGYAANLEKLRELMLKLASARLLEAKTANPERHAQVGLGDPAAEGATTTAVEFKLGDKTESLLIGNLAPGSTSSTFVRRPDNPQTYLASGNLQISTTLADWLAKQIVNIGTNEVQSVTLRHADGDAIEVAKDERSDTRFALQNIPEGREAQSEWVGDALGGFLTNLELEDVNPRAAELPAEVGTAEFRGFDGVLVELKFWTVDGATNARLEARVDEEQLARHLVVPEPTPPTTADPVAANAPVTPSDPATATAAEPSANGTTPASTPVPEVTEEQRAAAREQALATAREASSKRVAEINAVVAAWDYKLPSWKAGNLTKRSVEYLKPVEPPAAANE